MSGTTYAVGLRPAPSSSRDDIPSGSAQTEDPAPRQRRSAGARDGCRRLQLVLRLGDAYGDLRRLRRGAVGRRVRPLRRQGDRCSRRSPRPPSACGRSACRGCGTRGSRRCAGSSSPSSPGRPASSASACWSSTGSPGCTCSIEQVVVACAVSWVLLVVWRSAFRSWVAHNRRNDRFVRRVIIVGTDRRAVELARLFDIHPGGRDARHRSDRIAPRGAARPGSAACGSATTPTPTACWPGGRPKASWSAQPTSAQRCSTP